MKNIILVFAACAIAIPAIAYQYDLSKGETFQKKLSGWEVSADGTAAVKLNPEARAGSGNAAERFRLPVGKPTP